MGRLACGANPARITRVGSPGPQNIPG
jgi:hypothetical protein